MFLRYLFTKFFKLNIYLILLFVSTLIYKCLFLLEKNRAEHFLPKKVFIFAGYRITDDTVRILYLKNSWEKDLNLYFRFRVFDDLQKAESICQRSECPTFHDPYCILNGYLADIKIPKFYQHSYQQKIIEISTSTVLPLKTIQISLTDVRPKLPLKHFLGICLQPIFYLLSPKQLIAFFEYWISQKVTAFYIYQNSWSSEIEKVITFYSKHPKITVKLINWSDLPNNESNFNSNKFFRRLEFSLAMADCVYRSRAETQFLVMTDLDELIYIKSGQTVKKFIQTKAAKEGILAFWFSSAKIIGQSNLTQIWKILDKPIQAKLIVNAQLTKTINVHTVGESENPLKNIIINSVVPNEAIIIHSRFDYTIANGSLNSNILSMKNLLKFQDFLDYSVEKVFKILKFPNDKHEKIQQQIFKDFDECAAAFKGRPFCKSIYSCKIFLKNLDFIESKLIKASNSWNIL